MNDEKGYIMFKGVRNTVVTYDQENRIWTMELVNNPKVFATSTSLFENLLLGASRCDNNDNSPHYFFYLGPHDWTVYNDFFCSGDEGVVKFSLTHCNDDQPYPLHERLWPAAADCNGLPQYMGPTQP